MRKEISLQIPLQMEMLKVLQIIAIQIQILLVKIFALKERNMDVMVSLN